MASLTRDQVKAIVDSEETNEDELANIEKTHYAPLIQRLMASGQTNIDHKALIIVFTDLAHLLKRKGDLTGNVAYYTDAAILHQHVLTIMNEKLLDISDDFHRNLYVNLNDLQSRIFSIIQADRDKMRDVAEEANSYKVILSNLREYVDQCLVRTMDLDISDSPRVLYSKIATKMKNFLAKIYRDSEKQMLTPPPCRYAIIGLGSMALQQITPFSDLEFAILVENENCENYFKNLTHLAHFKVIGLGETVIAASKYGVDTRPLVHVGVNFDLGGKTPLGRIDNDKPYCLIQTVDGMLRYVYNKDDKISHIDKNLPYILENVCFVHGDEELVTAYQLKIEEFMAERDENDPHNRLNCEIRAIKLLEEGAVEYDFRETKHRKPPIFFIGDLEKLYPTKLGHDGTRINVKQDIYRLTDRLIYNFGLLYNVGGNSSWDIIDQLCAKNILTKPAAENLTLATSFATLLRLRAYMHNKAQNESMSIFPRQSRQHQNDILRLSEDTLREDGDLVQFFYFAMPLHEALTSFCEQHLNLSDDEKRSFFQDNLFYDDHCLNKGLVHFRLGKYKLARQYLGQAIDQTEGEARCVIYFHLGEVHSKLAQWPEAIECFQVFADFLERCDDHEWKPVLPLIYLKLGSAYTLEYQYEEALEWFEKCSKQLRALDLKERVRQHLTACCEYGIGKIDQEQGRYDEAEIRYNKSIKLLKCVHKQPHLEVTTPLDGMGHLCLLRRDFSKAIEYFEECLRMQVQILGEEPHMVLASTLESLASVYYMMIDI